MTNSGFINGTFLTILLISCIIFLLSGVGLLIYKWRSDGKALKRYGEEENAAKRVANAKLLKRCALSAGIPTAVIAVAVIVSIILSEFILFFSEFSVTIFACGVLLVVVIFAVAEIVYLCRRKKYNLKF